jgi:CheY-like chemotaxis protein
VAKRVLVVDDSRIMRDFCRSILQKAGYDVAEAWDASQARTALKQGDIGFVFCDLNIPGMDGLEFVEAMRREPAFAELPVAIATVERTPALLARARAAGVREWVGKPYDAQTLLALAERFVGPERGGP